MIKSDSLLLASILYLSSLDFSMLMPVDNDRFEDEVNFLLEGGFEIEDPLDEIQKMENASKVIHVAVASDKKTIKDFLLALNIDKVHVGNLITNNDLHCYKLIINIDDEQYLYLVMEIEVIKKRGHRITQEELHYKLDEAVKAEDYAQAAKLRDKIKKIENKPKK